MEKKKLKKIMTDLAAGHITQEEAETLLESHGQQKTTSRGRDADGSGSPAKPKSKANTRKRKLNATGGK